MSENIIMPKLGMTMKEGTVEEWFKSEGEQVKKGEDLLTISSEKLTQEIEAPASGTLIEIKVQAGEDAEVKSVLGTIGSEDENESTIKEFENSSEQRLNDNSNEEKHKNERDNRTETEKDSQTNTKVNSKEKRIFISPLARKMVEKEGLNITLIKGTGGNGRITKLDIQRVLKSGYDQEEETEIHEPTSNDISKESVESTQENIGKGLNPMRKQIAQNMRKSLNETAQLTLHRKVNADQLLEFKEKLSKEISQSNLDVKLSVTALLSKAIVLALSEYGAINARYENGTLTEYEEVNLGIATSLEDGLMVPVIQYADRKSIGSLAKEIQHKSEAVREGNTKDVQIQGATFTLTNMGASEIEYFTPILNLGETGILGVGSLSHELEFDNGEVKQVSRLPLSLTFDHQILDGAGAAEFLKVLAKYIENPYLLTL